MTVRDAHSRRDPDRIRMAGLRVLASWQAAVLLEDLGGVLLKGNRTRGETNPGAQDAKAQTYSIDKKFSCFVILTRFGEV